MPVQGRQRDGRGASQPPSLMPLRQTQALLHPQGGDTQAAPPAPPPQPPRHRTAPGTQAHPRGEERPRTRQGDTGTGPPPPQS